MHPADWKRLTPDERFLAVIRGEADPAIHWKVARVAELAGLDPEALADHVGAERGWEPHDRGFLARVVESARILLEESESVDGAVS